MLKIKVLFVIDRIMIGGAEQVFIDILKLMQGRVEPFVLLISRTEPKQLQRIDGLANVFQLNRSSKFAITSLIKTYRIIKTVDLLHVHLRPTFRYINLVRLLTCSRKPVLFHDHHHISDIGFMHQLLMFNLFQIDYYLAVNQDVLLWARDNWKFKLSGFLLNLPPTDKTETGLNLNKSFESELDYQGFVCVGNIKRSKNQLFAAFLALKLNEVVVFYGNKQDTEYYNELINQNRIIVTEGENNPSVYFNKYKFGLCTSRSESGPLVILEYFVAGLPFLSYKTGGIADVLYKYVPEYFLETFELNEWIDRYEELNRNYKRIPIELIEMVLEKEFNKEEYANQLMNIYTKCLKSAS
jgi:glycosyltransferase involved in cell wall biosynthesis